MDSFDKLINDIHSMAGLQERAATGFYPIYCPVCQKQDRKTGGFRFEGDEIVYNCFRATCDASCVYDKSGPPSKKFRRLMEHIGVTIPADLRLKKSSFQKKIEEDLESELYKKHTYREVDIPDGWVRLNPDKHRYCASFYESRKCDPEDVFAIESGKYRGLSAIPMYYVSKLIGFQIANPDGNVKYITHTEGNDHVLMINGGIVSDPVILVEGVMDAFCFPHAVGTLNSRLSPEQAYFLRGKRVIVFPDKKRGWNLIEAAFEYGWEVAVPPWNTIGDLNDAVVKYGKVTTAKMITEQAETDKVKVELQYKLWSKEKRR